MEWYRAQTGWTEAHRYADPQVCGVSLRDWFFAMKARFPAMNGPYATTTWTLHTSPTFSSVRRVIYCAFAWSVAEEENARPCSRRHRTTVSGFWTSAVRMPRSGMGRTGEYKVIYKASAP